MPPQAVTVRADNLLFNGTWRRELDDFRNASCKTEELSYAATTVQVRDALTRPARRRDAGGLGIEVAGAAARGGGRRAPGWTVTFPGEYIDLPPIRAAWRGYGCGTCDVFNDGWAQAPDRRSWSSSPTTTASPTTLAFVQEAALQPDDRSSGAWFGFSVAVDGDAAVVARRMAPARR